MGETSEQSSKPTVKRSKRVRLRQKSGDRRVIMRVDISPVGKELLLDLVNRQGMTNVATLSRLVEWFVAQPPEVQSRILNHVETESAEEVARLILKNIVMRIA